MKNNDKKTKILKKSAAIGTAFAIIGTITTLIPNTYSSNAATKVSSGESKTTKNSKVVKKASSPAKESQRKKMEVDGGLGILNSQSPKKKETNKKMENKKETSNKQAEKKQSTKKESEKKDTNKQQSSSSSKKLKKK